jgi:hypothetical protein
VHLLHALKVGAGGTFAAEDDVLLHDVLVTKPEQWLNIDVPSPPVSDA